MPLGEVEHLAGDGGTPGAGDPWGSSGPQPSQDPLAGRGVSGAGESKLTASPMSAMARRACPTAMGHAA